MESYGQLMEMAGNYYIILSLSTLLNWDQRVAMPESGKWIRSRHLASMAKQEHGILTSSRFEKLLQESKKLKLDKWQRANVRELEEKAKKAKRLPQDFVEECSKTTSLAYHIWKKAKDNSDFPSFAPVLEKIVKLQQRKAELMGPHSNPYEILMKDYEKSITLPSIRKQFDGLKALLVPLLKKIKESEAKFDMSHSKKSYSIRKQDRLSRMIAERMGFDFKRGRLDGRAEKSFHPFTLPMSVDDVRITTQYGHSDIMMGIGSTIHEAGHALYELGLPAEHQLEPVCQPRSLAVHESQSRLWENNVGLSRSFWGFMFPELKSLFPRQLKGYDAEKFYRSINKISPDLIRTESNEVTYNLHVLLRFEIEEMLINKKAKVSELPELWNARMKEYIGITPKNDTEGVLQDIHWSCGLIGYFPTYMLGTIWAAQIYNAASKNISDLEEQISRGELLELKQWLKDSIHSQGSLYSTSTLIKRATGKEPGAGDYISYIEDKYGKLYGLKALNKESYVE